MHAGIFLFIKPEGYHEVIIFSPYARGNYLFFFVCLPLLIKTLFLKLWNLLSFHSDYKAHVHGMQILDFVATSSYIPNVFLKMYYSYSQHILASYKTYPARLKSSCRDLLTWKMLIDNKQNRFMWCSQILQIFLYFCKIYWFEISIQIQLCDYHWLDKRRGLFVKIDFMSCYLLRNDSVHISI